MTRLSPALILLLSTGCSDHPVHAIGPGTGTTVCSAEELAFCQPSATDLRGGSAVAIASTGTGQSNEVELRYKVLGAPADPGEDTLGMVRVTELDTTTGDLQAPGPSNLSMDIWAPTGSGQFGWSLLTADVRECHRNPTPLVDTACGQELLVGAPDLAVGSTPGTVFWYHAGGDGWPAFTLGGQLTAPGLPAGADFGSAIAAPVPPPTGSPQPWEVAPNPTYWVAVGAPGADSVEIFSVDHTQPAPFTHVASLPAPSSAVGKGFGKTLLAADFDNDGVPDLAVGAPDDTRSTGGSPNGAVYVYKGNVSATGYLDAAPSMLQSTYAASTDEFGTALASGDLDTGFAGEVLAVGMPGRQSEAGGVCFYRLQTDSSGQLNDPSPLCYGSPNRGMSWGSTGRFGAALTVDNFSNEDSLGMQDTTAALQHELAVGSPAAHNEEGLVQVFHSTPSGPDLYTVVASLDDPNAASLNPGEVPHFGHSLASGYVQELGWADLNIGSPGRHGGLPGEVGQASITRAHQNTSSGAQIEGIWEVEDSLGRMVAVRIIQDPSIPSTSVVFTDDFFVHLVDSATGNDCEVTQKDEDENRFCGPAVTMIPAGTPISLPAATSVGGTCPEVFSWVGLNQPVLIQALMASQLDLSDLGPVAQASLNALATTANVDVDIGISDASACGLVDDEIEIDLGLPAIWGVISAVDPEQCFASSCLPELPVDGTIVTHDICE